MNPEEEFLSLVQREFERAAATARSIPCPGWTWTWRSTAACVKTAARN